MSAPDPSKRDVQISKALSYLLRHGAIKEKLNIDEEGYIKIQDILSHNRIKTHRVTVEDIHRIVRGNDKQRFSIVNRNGIEYICATQGHSIESVSEANLRSLTREEMPREVFHGTYKAKLPSIMNEGLSRMGRNHIHFASCESNVSGIRKNCNVLIYLNIDDCFDKGITFYKSANGVVLTRGLNGILPSTLFDRVIDVSTGNSIVNKAALAELSEK
ncbi:uncharacterized protein PRCAT00002299001 [Priceomyces carsonii]|uniref:uncharacterized protein n=1 Tax=Priceomyces carsonii TaxID=28549 RepID=UPI002ED92A84|nr:unnamed protein product [Priceomyces carsonii]